MAERKFDFFDMKGSVEELFKHINISAKKCKFNDITEKYLNVFDTNSTEIFINKEAVGIVGAINKNVLNKFEIDVPVFIAAIDLTTISEINIDVPYYSPISTYPIVKRDLAFVIDNKYSVKDIKKHITDKASSLLRSVIIFDVYTGKNIEEDKRSIGFELTFSSMERTLTDQEIETEINTIIKSVEKNYNAVLRK
jgi:phenylalanyl-tRNA synthetase beta chain